MPVTPDTSVFSKLQGFADYQRANQEFEMKKQIAQANVLQSQAAIMKAQELDADKLGQTAFLKAAQGIPLTPTETAALKYIDAKSPTAAFNPVTGVLEQKPSLIDRAGLNIPTTPNQPTRQPTGQTSPVRSPSADISPPDNGVNPAQPVVLSTDGGKNEWDAEYQKQLAAAAGNPKLQQTIKSDYAKSKMAMNDAESKNAGFADRMLESNLKIEQYKAAGMDVGQISKGAIPLIGNFVVSDDYQSFNQAQRDFINAQLRRESGAVINPDEFKNAAKQYFPQAGDSEQVLLQKKANRDAAVGGMVRSAGPAYKMPTVAKQPDGKQAAETDFQARKVASPEQIAAFKKKHGIK
ncbi:MAG: hypothetical protein KA770_00235 [Shewanella sp.]|nr:hypothetical protein [Shewanella sp.]